LTDQTKKEDWIELKDPIMDCKVCMHFTKCISIQRHIQQCYKAKYRFRCPIEVLDERTEE